MLLATNASGQVSHDPQPRSALIEQFTALHCGNCPAGHVVSHAITTAYPQNTVIVSVHAGSLAVPSGNEPELRTAWGDSLHTQLGVPFTPLALVGRRAYGGDVLLSSAEWTNATTALLAFPSPVNVALANAFDTGTRELTVAVETYYTADGTGATDHLHVLLTEDHIIGWQSNYGPGGHYSTYDHRHVLRAYLTPLAGEMIAGNNVGDLTTKTFSMVVPIAWDIAQCRVVAFVSEGSGISGEVYQTAQAAANNGTSDMVDPEPPPMSCAFPMPADSHLFVPVGPDMAGAIWSLRDMQGRSVLHVRLGVAGTTESVPVSGLPPGYYVCGTEGGENRQRVLIAH